MEQGWGNLFGSEQVFKFICVTDALPLCPEKKEIVISMMKICVENYVSNVTFFKRKKNIVGKRQDTLLSVTYFLSLI